MSTPQLVERRRWARGLLAQGLREEAVRYLTERKLGLWELPETHAFPLPKRRRNNVHYVNCATLSPSPTLPPPDLATSTTGGEGVARVQGDGNAIHPPPPGGIFQSETNNPSYDPSYDPSKEPSFKDRLEGTWEKGTATPALRQRSWVAEVGIEELAGFAEKPRPIESQPVEEPMPSEAPPEGENGLKSQGNGVPEAPEAYASWPAECEVEVTGTCPNNRLLVCRVLGGEGLPDGGRCSLWKAWGRTWPVGARLRARMESGPLGPIIYEPLGD